MPKKSFDLTEAEWLVLQTIWDNQPAAAPTVQEALVNKKKWSYSTVKTIMDRMVKKGLLKTERIRNLILYRPTLTKQQARKSEILRAARRAFDGALTPMMQFLLENNMSGKQLAELEEILKRAKSQKSKNGSQK
jgi:BlaI family penicillinase repressor